jgi:hypothetical protein
MRKAAIATGLQIFLQEWWKIQKGKQQSDRGRYLAQDKKTTMKSIMLMVCM